MPAGSEPIRFENEKENNHQAEYQFSQGSKNSKNVRVDIAEYLGWNPKDFRE
jgi:hypothetical protein